MVPNIDALISHAIDAYLPSGWATLLAEITVIIAVASYSVNKIHAMLPKIISLVKALREVSATVVASVERHTQLPDKRPPGAHIQATIVTGDMVMYWSFFAYFVALGATTALLPVVARSHNVGAIAASYGISLGSFVISMIARKKGVEGARGLCKLFKDNAEKRFMRYSLTACVGLCGVVVIGVGVFVFKISTF